MPYTDNQRRQHIAELQGYIRFIEMTEKGTSKIIPSGVYGDAEKEAVRAFQQAHGLTATGDTDPDTWDCIVAVYRGYSEKTPLHLAPFPHSRHICEKGSEGLIVRIIQAMLSHLADIFDNIPDTSVCGTFDDKTAQAVSAFRSCCGLPEGESVDCDTWNMLVSCCSHKF